MIDETPLEDWLREKEVGARIPRKVTYTGMENGVLVKKTREFEFVLLPGTVADEIDTVLIKRDEDDNPTGDADMGAGSRELVRMSLNWSRQDIDLLITHKGLGLFRALEVIANEINGPGTEREIDRAKNGDAPVSAT